MTLAFHPIRVATGFEDEGMLVFDGEQRLVAVLSHLAEDNEVAPGHWFLEAGFGQVDGINRPTFANLDAAKNWIRHRLAKT